MCVLMFVCVCVCVLMFVCVCVCAYVCVYMCVCSRKREIEREREGERKPTSHCLVLSARRV